MMNELLARLVAALQESRQSGQGLVEYALILAFVALLVIVALVFLRQQIQSGYSRIGNSIPTS